MEGGAVGHNFERTPLEQFETAISESLSMSVCHTFITEYLKKTFNTNSHFINIFV